MLSQLTSLLGLGPALKAPDTQKGEKPVTDFASVFAHADADPQAVPPEPGEETEDLDEVTRLGAQADGPDPEDMDASLTDPEPEDLTAAPSEDDLDPRLETTRDEASRSREVAQPSHLDTALVADASATDTSLVAPRPDLAAADSGNRKHAESVGGLATQSRGDRESGVALPTRGPVTAAPHVDRITSGLGDPTSAAPETSPALDPTKPQMGEDAVRKP
jgi:hypothetical protein